MGFFDKVGEARSSSKNPGFLSNSRFKVRIEEVKFAESTNPQSDLSHLFAITGTILESSNEQKLWTDPEDNFLRTSRVGDLATHLITFKKSSFDAAMGQVRAFASTCHTQWLRQFDALPEETRRGAIERPEVARAVELARMEPGSYGQDHIEILYATHLYEGLILQLATQTVTTRARKPFTQHQWFPLTQEQ